MTRQRDIESLLDLWLGEGSNVAPDRVIDVVADRIERQRQWPGWRFPRRELQMNTSLRIAAGLAALAIVGTGLVYLYGSPPAGPGGPPTSSPAPSASPAATARVISSAAFQPRFNIQVPPGWVTSDGTQAFMLTTNGNETTGTPGGTVEFKPRAVVGSNANDCEGLAAEGVGPSVDEMIAALSTDPRFATVSAGTVTLGGTTGKMLEVRLSRTWTQTCKWSGGKPAALLLTVANPPGPFVGLIGTERIRVILVDVNGVVVSITIGTADLPYFDAFVAEAMSMVETVQFMP